MEKKNEKTEGSHSDYKIERNETLTLQLKTVAREPERTVGGSETTEEVQIELNKEKMEISNGEYIDHLCDHPSLDRSKIHELNINFHPHEIQSNISPTSTSNDAKTPKVSILSEVVVEMILNEKSGCMEILKPKKVLKPKPEIGKYVLANFLSKRPKNYKYVCIIEDVSGENIVVKGLKSTNKQKTSFKTIHNDISITDINDILEYLPDPETNYLHCVFPRPVNVKEV